MNIKGYSCYSQSAIITKDSSHFPPSPKSWGWLASDQVEIYPHSTGLCLHIWGKETIDAEKKYWVLGHIIAQQWFGMRLKQTDERGLYRYLPSVDNGCAGGRKARQPQKMPRLPGRGDTYGDETICYSLSFSLRKHDQVKFRSQRELTTWILVSQRHDDQFDQVKFWQIRPFSLRWGSLAEIIF